MDFRTIMHNLFGTKYVILTDLDGERNIRRAKKIGKKMFASRMFKNDVILENDGKCYGTRYCTKWEYLFEELNE